MPMVLPPLPILDPESCIFTHPIIDIAKMGMWEPIQNLLASPSSSDAIQKQVLWIVGTAVQNNPSAQTSVRSRSLPFMEISP